MATTIASTDVGGTGLSTVGTNGQVLTSNGTTLSWVTPSASTLTGTLGVANGGTGLTSLTAGYIPYGNGTSAFGSSSNLFWDSTNSRLGIGTSSPAYPIQATGTLDIISILGSGNAFFRAQNKPSGTVTGDFSFGADNGAPTGTNSFIIYDRINSGYRFLIDNSGNWRLGTSGTSIQNSSGRPMVNQTGGILQVISTTSSSAVATTSATMVDTGISATITPSSTSSRILVMVTGAYLKVGAGGGAASGSGLAIYNGSGTLLYDSQRDGGGVLDGWTEVSGVGVFGAVISKQFVHSPATASAYTYKIYIAQRNGGTMTLNYASSTFTTLTLMEIAG